MKLELGSHKKHGGRHDPRTATYNLSVDDFILYMWNNFGIMIEDRGSYHGFVKSPEYVIYFPELDPETKTVISFKRNDCRRVCVRTMSDVKRWIRRDYKRNTEYYENLGEDMSK